MTYYRKLQKKVYEIIDPENEGKVYTGNMLLSNPPQDEFYIKDISLQDVLYAFEQKEPCCINSNGGFYLAKNFAMSDVKPIVIDLSLPLIQQEKVCEKLYELIK